MFKGEVNSPDYIVCGEQIKTLETLQCEYFIYSPTNRYVQTGKMI